jgi:hypothetical protein
MGEQCYRNENPGANARKWEALQAAYQSAFRMRIVYI